MIDYQEEMCCKKGFTGEVEDEKEIVWGVILSFASKSDDANSSSYGAGITSTGGR
jgi:hypothetical protein